MSTYQGWQHNRALHWVPMPMPTHAHGFWVGMGAILMFMSGHGWASVLYMPTSSSKSESNFSDARHTLTKKRSGLKPTTMNDLYLSNPTKTWCRRVMHIRQFLNT